MKSRTQLRAAIATIATVGLIAAPVGASAASNDVASAYAEGRFLAGSVAGIELDSIVELAAARAVNDGTAPLQEVKNPLSATVLSSVRVASTPVAITGLDGVSLGAVGQYARASNDGRSFASSGAIGSDGAISANARSGSSAVVHLTPLLGAGFTANVADLSLSVEAIAAQAEATLSKYSGDYTLAGLALNFQLPAAKSLPGLAATALEPVQRSLASLAGPSGSVAKAIDSVLRQNNPALSILGNAADVTVTVNANLNGLVEALTSAVLKDAALTLDLKSGAVTVDLSKLPSTKNLNGLPPGTELLSKAVVSDIVAGLTRLLSNHVKGVEKTLRAAVEKAGIAVSVQLSLLDRVKTGERVIETVTTVTQVVDKVTGKVLGVVDTATGKVTSLVDGVTGSELRQALDGLLGGLLAKLLGLGNGVVTKVVNDVSTVIEPVFSTLETKVDLRLKGTVNQFRSGTGVTASADLKVLGAKVGLDSAVLIAPITSLVQGALLSSSSPAAKAVDGLSSSVLTPLLAAVGGNQTTSLGSLLGNAVSVKANVQETSTSPDGKNYFTQTALRVSVLDGVATLNLANATVGPNSTNGGGGGSDDPDDEADDDAPPPSGGGGGGFLASTGGLLAVLGIVAALALLAFGTYLVIRNRMASAATGSDAAEELIV